jgi:hypothetical protein
MLRNGNAGSDTLAYRRHQLELSVFLPATDLTDEHENDEENHERQVKDWSFAGFRAYVFRSRAGIGQVLWLIFF